jgi:hypothetical protein
MLCISARAEILIYSTTVTGFAAEGDGVVDLYDRSTKNWRWGIGERLDKGFLILDVDIDPDTQIVEINKATQIEYWKEGKEKYYERVSGSFEIDKIVVDKKTYWVLRDIFATGDDRVLVFMAKGKVRMSDVGLGSRVDRREIQLKLSGFAMTFLQDGDTEMESIYEEIYVVSLRLHKSWTKTANEYWVTYNSYLDYYSPLEWAVGGVDKDGQGYGIVEEWLQERGYDEGHRSSVIDDYGARDDDDDSAPSGIILY